MAEIVDTPIDYYLLTKVNPFSPVEKITKSLKKLVWRGKVRKIRLLDFQDPSFEEQLLGYVNGGQVYVVFDDPSVHRSPNQQWARSQVDGCWYRFVRSMFPIIGLQSKKDHKEFAKSVFDADFSLDVGTYGIDPHGEFYFEDTYSNIEEYKCNNQLTIQNWEDGMDF